MRPKKSGRKRPCRICRKWFSPDPRLRERQKTCGNEECQRQWHAKKCREWNNKNRPYFREIYLEKRLASCEGIDEQPALPHNEAVNRSIAPTTVQEVISIQLLVIIGYLLRQPVYCLQEVINSQRTENIKNRRRLIAIANSRGDSRTSPHPVS